MCWIHTKSPSILVEPAPLVAIAHGSRDPRAAATVEELLGLAHDRAAGRGLDGLTVRAAFLGHAAPSPAQVLGGLDSGPVVVLPLLLTAAHHSKTDIPGVLAAAPPRLRISYGEPLGPDPLLIDALEHQLAAEGIDPGDPADAAGTSVVLAAAGSSDPAAAAALRGLAARWRALRGWRDVVLAYASVPPATSVTASVPPATSRTAAGSPLAVAEAVGGLRASGARRVVVASYLLAPGRFATQIRDQGLAAGAAAVSGVLGGAPELADLVLRRYESAVRASKSRAA